MSESAIDNISAKLKLKFEDAPPFGGGSMPVEKEKTMVMLAHFFSWIVWLLMRKQSPAVDAHGKEATNFAITILIFYIPLGIVLGFLPGFLLTIVSLLLLVVWLGLLLLVIIAMIKAKEGKLMRYPINFRLIK
ncbi:MAG TPA: DUF4870 domain-containing protein [Verrucomicrobiales bacterium]|jgi:uncharacterized Tic20 family protein|nr:DUF4870 domain-containing protein [Verrucomicrobiales bacterium]